MAGETAFTCGGGTLKTTLLLVATPPTVIVTLPLTAVAGTTAEMLVSLQEVTVTEPWAPLNWIVLLPCEAPNPLPLICTAVSTGPEDGVMVEINGFGRVKTWSVLLVRLLFATTAIAPVRAFVGTAATICESLQEITFVAVAPLNDTEPF